VTARSEQPIAERPGAVLDMLRSVRDGKAEWTDVAAKLTKYKFVKPPPRPVPSTTDPNWWSDVDAYDPSLRPPPMVASSRRLNFVKCTRRATGRSRPS
jgi:hypothetical protein